MENSKMCDLFPFFIVTKWSIEPSTSRRPSIRNGGLSRFPCVCSATTTRISKSRLDITLSAIVNFREFFIDCYDYDNDGGSVVSGTLVPFVDTCFFLRRRRVATPVHRRVLIKECTVDGRGGHGIQSVSFQILQNSE